MKTSVLFAWSAAKTVRHACEMLLPVFPPYRPLMIGEVQLLVGSFDQPKLPGASAPAGSVGHPVFDWVVCSFSTRSKVGEGSGLGGYGGGGANKVPFWVA